MSAPAETEETRRRPYGAGSLYTRENADGSETYYGRWRTDDGRQPRAVVGLKRKPGTRQGLTVKQAENKLGKLIAEYEPEPLRPDDKTFKWAADRMVADMRRVKEVEPQTIDGYERDLTNHLDPALGQKALTAITREDAEALVAKLDDKGLAPKTIQNITRLAGQVFNYGRKRPKPWCTANPVEGVALPKVERPVDDVPHFRQPEVPRVLATIDSSSEFAAVDHALWLTSAMTGLRQGELLALRWRDVDWTAQKITVRLNRTRKHEDRSPKSKASRRSVPLPDIIGGVLDRLFKASNFQDEDDRVFGHPVTGDVLDYSKLDRRFNAAVKRAKVRRITFHGLRHTFAVQCARAGVPMRTLQHWLGHARSSTTEIYAQFATDQAEVAMVEAAFGSLAQSLAQSEPTSPEVKSGESTV